MFTHRVTEIDLVRFLAALAVLLFHYGFRGYHADAMTVMPYPLLDGVARYGYLGVHLFFMISGFVILMTASKGGAYDFAVSRITRLYPAFWTCCTLTFLATLAIGAPRYSATLGQFAANLTMLNAFVGVPSIDGAYWSLAVEIQFYAFIALVMLSGRLRQIETALLVWLSLALVLFIVPNKAISRLVIGEFAPYFAAGCLFYLIRTGGVTKRRLMLLGATLALALVQAFQESRMVSAHYHAEISAVVAMSAVTAFFGLFALVITGRTGVLRGRNFALLGAISYPLYLIHQNLGYMVFNLLSPSLNHHLLFWGMTSAAIMIAYGVNRLVEQPLAPLLKRALLALRLPRRMAVPA